MTAGSPPDGGYDPVHYLALLLGTTASGRRERSIQRRLSAARGRTHDGAVRAADSPGDTPAWISAHREDADRDALADDQAAIDADEQHVRAEMIAAHTRVTGTRPVWADPDEQVRAGTASAVQRARDDAQNAENDVIRTLNREHVLRQIHHRANIMLVIAVGITLTAGAAAVLATAALGIVAAMALLGVSALIVLRFRTVEQLRGIPAELDARTDARDDAHARVTLAMSAHYINGGDPWRDANTWPAVQRATVPRY